MALLLSPYFRCYHGTAQESTSDGTKQVSCKCDPCYAGDECESLCNDVVGATCNETLGICDCGFYGMRGDTCDVAGCPGHGESCSGHGTCNPLSKPPCSCNPGWEGEGCENVKCPGNCSQHGDCVPEDQPYCKCYPGYFGLSCAHYCQNGNVTLDSDDEEYCKCDPCYNEDDLECATECSDHGSCSEDGTCDCGKAGWRGDFCEKPGCPGAPGPDPGLGCSGHGACKDNIGKIGKCECDAFWYQDGCDLAICKNNCSDHGECNTEGDVPFCQCHEGWMNDDCSIFCHGTVDVINNECVCDNECQDASDFCEKTCNDIGRCVDGQCLCYNETGFNALGYWGKRCTDLGCPGQLKECSDHGLLCDPDSRICTCKESWQGNYCNIPDCPGFPDCNGFGTCDGTQDPPKCQCYVGYMGQACESECVNGDPMSNEDGSEWGCVCHSCYTGESCKGTCSGQGTCSVNNTCVCNSGFWGKCDFQF